MKKTREVKHTERAFRRNVTARVLAMLLSLVLVIELIPFTVAGATSVDSATSVDDLLSYFNTSQPSEYGSTATPYGYSAGQTFQIAAENELVMFLGADGSSSMTWYDGFNRTEDQNDLSTVMDETTMFSTASSAPFEDMGTYSSVKNYAFMEAVAFDPFGTGRKDHVAYVGLRYSGDNNKDGEIMLWVLDVNTGAISIAYTVAEADYMCDNGFEQYEAKNLFAITAGRYTDSMEETIVVYVAGEGSDVSLYEYEVTSKQGASKIWLDKVGSSSVSDKNNYFHEKASSAAGLALVYQNNKYAKPGVSLASGDLNGDGIDELIVLSYWAADKYTYDIFKNDYKYQMAQLCVVKGGGSGTILGRSNSKK